MKTTLDLRQNNVMEFLVDQGSIGVITFSGISQMDTGYTLILDEGLTTEQTFTVGSGIDLDVPTSSINWTFDTTGWEKKIYTGQVVSDSRVLGIYFKIKIEFHVS